MRAAKDSIGGISSHHLYASIAAHASCSLVPPTRAMFLDPQIMILSSHHLGDNLMFLLRCKTRHSDSVKLFDTQDEARAEADRFVGVHSPMDGCSSEPDVQEIVLGRTKISRSTSFGIREAWILPQLDNGRFDL